jgi:bacteriorhodopsin
MQYLHVQDRVRLAQYDVGLLHVIIYQISAVYRWIFFAIRVCCAMIFLLYVLVKTP